MPSTATLTEVLAPLRSEPARSAVLLDVDGTLAPIVRHADDAAVPETTRSLLIEISRAYGLVACVSGRRSADARRIVSLGSIAYVGAHGGELLLPGRTEAVLDADLASWRGPIQRFLAEADTTELQQLRVRAEDKGAIAAFHWRGAPDEKAAFAAVQELAAGAEADGFVAHWGRKVLEVRPPVRIDKGVGIHKLLAGAGMESALYVGDDVTDLDAFRGLRELVSEGSLGRAVTVAVGSDEMPADLREAADLVVSGTDGVRALLVALAG